MERNVGLTWAGGNVRVGELGASFGHVLGTLEASQIVYVLLLMILFLFTHSEIYYLIPYFNEHHNLLIFFPWLLTG